VGNIDGYRVVTSEGKTVGRVVGESEVALVVEYGIWPWKAWRALPKVRASVKEEERCVVMQMSREFLARSPKLQKGAPVDDKAVASWWALN
jgi:hypothetical protein